MNRISNGVLSLVMALALSGCVHVTRMYDGADLPKDNIVLLKGDRTLEVTAVDGVVKKYTPTDFRGPLVYWGFKIYLVPGPHNVTIGYWSGRTYSPRNITLSFNAEPGHVYWIHDGRASWRSSNPMTWNPHIEDITHGHKLP